MYWTNSRNLRRGPSAIDRREHGDPNLVPSRFLNDGRADNPAFRFSIMSEFRNVPTADAHLKLRAGRSDDNDFGGELHLPGGSVEIVGLGPNVTFRRWQENFLQPE
jgi:hypothetical protein